MANNFYDVRAKVPEIDHAVLTAVAQATGKDINEIVRELIAQFAASELHGARTVIAITRGREGVSGNVGD